MQNRMLDRILCDEIDDRHRAFLALAPGSSDTLLELGQIPWQIEIDDGVRHLEIQAGRAGVGGEEQLASRILAEACDLGGV